MKTGRKYGGIWVNSIQRPRRDANIFGQSVMDILIWRGFTEVTDWQQICLSNRWVLLICKEKLVGLSIYSRFELDVILIEERFRIR